MPVDVRPPFPPDAHRQSAGCRRRAGAPVAHARVALGVDEGSARAWAGGRVLRLARSGRGGGGRPQRPHRAHRRQRSAGRGDRTARRRPSTRRAAEGRGAISAAAFDRRPGRRLVSRYASLRSVATAAPSVGRVLFIVGIEGAPLRYRAWLPAEALALKGVESEVRWFTDPDLHGAAARADVVIVYRVPATTWVLEVLDEVRRRSVPILFDADDLIFDPDIAAEIPALSILPEADASSGSKEFTATARRWKRATGTSRARRCSPATPKRSSVYRRAIRQRRRPATRAAVRS